MREHSFLEEEQDALNQLTNGFNRSVRTRIYFFVVRIAIASLLAFIFWDYDWIRWGYLIYLSLSVVGFILLLRLQSRLNQKMLGRIKQTDRLNVADLFLEEE